MKVNIEAPKAPFTINYDINIAYSTLTVMNDSCLYYEHVNSSNGAVLDYFYLMKGPEYPYPQRDYKYLIIGGIALLGLIVGLVFAYRRFKKPKEEDVYVKVQPSLSLV